MERKLELRAKELAAPWQKATFIVTGISIALAVVTYFGIPPKIEGLIAEKMSEAPLRQAAINAATNAVGTYVAEKLAPLTNGISSAFINLTSLQDRQSEMDYSIQNAKANAESAKSDLLVLRNEQLRVQKSFSNAMAQLNSNLLSARSDLEAIQANTKQSTKEAADQIETLQRLLNEATTEINRIKQEQNVIGLVARVEGLSNRFSVN